MKKSIVQELNGLAQSTVVNRSFIQTTATDQIYDMRKSRINNLPNYKKQDLSGKLNFIVVFQGIQIERLSTEVETLRVSLKEAERASFNNGNYEVQIKQLNQRCVGLQMEIEQYKQEIEKMNMISQKLYDELEEMKRRYAEVDTTLKQKYRLERQRNDDLQQQVEKWKARMRALETSKNKEMEDLRNMMESQRQSMMNRELRELQIKFDSQRKMLQGEVRKLREAHENKNSENIKLKSQISRLETFVRQLREDQQRMHDYQNKIVMISQETMRLNEILRARQEEIDRLRNNEARLQQKLSENENLAYTLNQIKNTALQLENELSNQNTRVSRLEEEKRRNQIQLEKIPEYERLLDSSSNQIERLNQIIRDKISQNENLSKEYKGLEAKYRENKEERLPQMQNKVNNLLAENDRINGILKDRLQDLQQWKNRCLGLQKTIDKYIVLEQEKQRMQGVIKQKDRQLQQKNHQLHHLQQYVHKLQGLQSKLVTEENKSKELIREIQRLNNVVRSKSQEVQNFIRKIQNYERDISSLRNLQNELNEHRKKSAFLTKELDRINGVIVEKTHEIQHLRDHFRKIETGLAESKKVEQKLYQNMKQMEELIIQLDESRKQTDFFQDKLVQAQNEIRRVQNQVFNMNQQKQQLNVLINQRKSEIEQTRLELRQKEAEIRHAREFQVRYNEANNKFKNLQGRYQDLERKNRQENSRAEDLNGKLKTLTANIERIKKEGVLSQAFISQFMNVKKQCEFKDKEIKNLEDRFQIIEKVMKALRGELEKQVKFGQQNHNKWIEVGTTLNGFGQFMRKSINMHNELTKISEDNVLLESSARMANFQLQVANKLSSSRVIGSFGVENSNIDILRQFNESESSKNFRVNELKIVGKRTALQPITKFQF